MQVKQSSVIAIACISILIVFGIVGMMDMAHLKDDVHSLKAESIHENHRVKRSCENTPPAATQAPTPATTQLSVGSMYFRWGSSKCGADSELLYEGIVGGGSYSHTGAAVNALCLPRDPVLQDATVDVTDVAYIYGAEYEEGSVKDHDVVCAVCYTRSRTTNIMIPAKTTCPNSWQMEYIGMLMAGHYNHVAGTEYICVDNTFESDHGGHENKNGKLLYYVKPVCGSLPCPNYANHKYLPCVVCSK